MINTNDNNDNDDLYYLYYYSNVHSDRPLIHTHIYTCILYIMTCEYIFTNRVSVGSLTYIESVRRISLYMCILYYIIHIYYIHYT